MQTRTLGSSLTVSTLGLGCMGMSEFYGPRDDQQSLQVLRRAVELGVSFFDTADMYGPHHNEELLGRFLASCSAEERDRLVIATKFGIVRSNDPAARNVRNDPDYIRQCCEASLRRLGVERIDLYYMHRLEKGRPVEEAMGVLSELVQEGKIGHIGLCEVSPETIRRAHDVHAVTAIQTEYSLWTRDVEDEILPLCRELGIGFVPYSPLGRGFLTGTFKSGKDFGEGDFRAALPRFAPENLAANMAIADKVHHFASERNASPAQVALAWLLAQGEDIVPIPGTKKLRWLEDNCAAPRLTLTPQEVETLGETIAALPVVGDRYTPVGMATLDG